MPFSIYLEFQNTIVNSKLMLQIQLIELASLFCIGWALLSSRQNGWRGSDLQGVQSKEDFQNLMYQLNCFKRLHKIVWQCCCLGDASNASTIPTRRCWRDVHAMLTCNAITAKWCWFGDTAVVALCETCLNMPILSNAMQNDATMRCQY